MLWYLGTSDLLTIFVVMPWTCAFATYLSGFTNVWKVLFLPPRRIWSAISMILSFSLLNPVVSISKTILVKRLAKSLFSAVSCSCWMSQYWIFWNWLISVLFIFKVALVETVSSKTSCLMLLDLLFRAILILPSVFVVTGLLVHFLEFPPSIPWLLESCSFELVLYLLVQLWNVPLQKLANVLIRHRGPWKIERHMGTVLIWIQNRCGVQHHKGNWLSPTKATIGRNSEKLYSITN